jgi:hypothetical protein
LVLTFSKPTKLLAAQMWAGYAQVSDFEDAAKVWANPITSPGVFGAAIYMGGLYYHKHATPITWGGTTYVLAQYQNDYYPLKTLADLNQSLSYYGKGPLSVAAGSTITIDRDMSNIDPTRTFTAWDVELILDVDEG